MSHRESIRDVMLALAAAATGVGIAAALARRSLPVLTALLGLATIVGSLFAAAGVVQRDAVVILCGAALIGGAILLEIYARDLVLDTLPLPSNITLPPSSIVIGVGSALLVGLVASLIPATTAARANVIQVLRG